MKTIRTLKALFAFSCAVAFSFTALADDAMVREGKEIPFVEGDTPPMAPHGYFWCLVSHHETYVTKSEEVEVRKATSYFEIVSAKYELQKEYVEVVPKRNEAVVVPAEFNTEKHEYVVKPEYTILEVVPATFEWVEETIVVTPEYQEEVYIPATYKSVTEEIEVAPARTVTRKVQSKKHNIRGTDVEWCYCTEDIPAKTQTIRKQVLDQEGRTEMRTIAAVTEKVKVYKEVNPAEVKKTVVPAKTDTIAKRVLVSDGKIEFRNIPSKSIEIERLVQVAAEEKQKVTIPALTEKVSHKSLERSAELVWVLMSNRRCLDKYPSVPGTPMTE